jgi:uncharacterized membrane protein YdjX (TVP38/TMEM64 family)
VGGALIPAVAGDVPGEEGRIDMGMERGAIQKAAVVLGIGILIGLFILLDLDRYLTLSFLKESRDSFVATYERSPALVIGTYFLIYTLVAAFSVPGAVVMTLAGGALLGLFVGTVVVSFASSIGATLACFISRFLLRDWVHGRFGDKLQSINRGIEGEGAFYLFTLRLVPIFPFFVVNLAMGLTRMPLPTYYWVSQLGMFPATLVYVNAGRELGRIDSPAGILSPGLLISLAILGLFPIGVKKTLAWYRARSPAGDP